MVKLHYIFSRDGLQKRPHQAVPSRKDNYTLETQSLLSGFFWTERISVEIAESQHKVDTEKFHAIFMMLDGKSI